MKFNNAALDAMRRGTHCTYCGQELFNASGAFECGGDGEGICSVWCAINAFGDQCASLPKYVTIDVGAWIDAWVEFEVGQSWDEVGWSRDLHLRGVREMWCLP